MSGFAGPVVECPNCGALVLLVEHGRELYLEGIAAAKAAGRKPVGLMVGDNNDQPATIADETGAFRRPTCETEHIYSGSASN